MPHPSGGPPSAIDKIVMQVEGLPSPALGLLTVGLLVGTFVLDLVTPMGIAAWAPYPIAIITALWWKGRKGALLATATSLVLVLLGAWISPGVSQEHVVFGLINRGFGVVLLILVGMLCVRLDKREQAEAVAKQTRSGEARQKVGCILLGRGSDKPQVHKWLRVAAPVPGFIGFAVGRTNFSEPLKRFLENRNEEAAAVEAIAKNFKECIDVWQSAARG